MVRTFFYILLLSISVQLNAKIYDCFPFFNELDLLEVRLNELYDHVDYFVLIEFTETYRGIPKPLYYNENKERFQKFADKIIHIIVDQHYEIDNAWARENFQRDQILKFLPCKSNDDIILYSDVDEILRHEKIPEIVSLIKSGHHPLRCHQPLYRFYLNLYDSNGWTGTCATTYANFKNDSPFHFRFGRDARNYPIVNNAGWHFTCMGGLDSWILKINSFPPHNLEGYNSEDGMYRWMSMNNIHPVIVPIDNTYPKFIKEHIEYFDKIGWISHK